MSSLSYLRNSIKVEWRRPTIVNVVKHANWPQNFKGDRFRRARFCDPQECLIEAHFPQPTWWMDFRYEKLTRSPLRVEFRSQLRTHTICLRVSICHQIVAKYWAKEFTLEQDNRKNILIDSNNKHIPDETNEYTLNGSVVFKLNIYIINVDREASERTCSISQECVLHLISHTSTLE